MPLLKRIDLVVIHVEIRASLSPFFSIAILRNTNNKTS